MKAPDQNLLAEQHRLINELKEAEFARNQAVEDAKAARKKLDTFVKDKGDIIAAQAGFERHQEFMNRTIERTPEWEQWFEGVKQKTAAMEEAMCGVWWDKIEDGKIIPFAECFEIFNPELIGPLEFGQFRPTATMADLVVRLGLFSSLTEARKAGHVKPLTVGEHRFKNGKFGIKRVKIYEYNET